MPPAPGASWRRAVCVAGNSSAFRTHHVKEERRRRSPYLPLMRREYRKAFQELCCLFREPARGTAGCCGMEDSAMLVFYLPIIIFEAMLESRESKRIKGPRQE